MILETLGPPDAYLHRIDPRVRFLAAIVLSVFFLFLNSWEAQLASVAAACLLCAMARLPLKVFVHRLVAVNLFMFFLIVLLPWRMEGTALLRFGPVIYAEEGLAEALHIALRGNAIVLALTALIGALEPVTLGHALERLWVPKKLIQLFLFTVRYIAVLEDEYQRLRLAMRVRAFQPRLDGHTLRSYGHLVGMLLVRAIEKSERINDAMKCRGFHGVFPTFHEFRVSAHDGLFAVCALGVVTVLGLLN